MIPLAAIPRDLQRQAVRAEALGWLGTPYHHLADIRGVGVDCAMLLVRVYAAVGLVPLDLDPRPYASDWHLHRSEEKYLGWLERYASPVPTGDAQVGDVMTYHFGRCFSHAGICLGGGELLHAWRAARAVIISRLDDADLLERREGVPRAAVCMRLHALAGEG